MNLIQLSSVMQTERGWRNRRKPFENSIVNDILYLVCHHTLIGESLTYKDVFTSIHHSKNGIRKNLVKLEQLNYLVVNRSSFDKRNKEILATQECMKIYIEYLNTVINSIEIEKQKNS